MDELLNRYQQNIAELTFHPSSGGIFEVTVGDEKVFSKKELGRFAEPGEIMGIIASRQGWNLA
jgi:selenoprotein W-related protein